MIEFLRKRSRHDPLEDEHTDLAGLRRWAREQVAYQHDPAITAAWSPGEVAAKRTLAERIRASERHREWKRARAAAEAEDLALRTQRAIDRADTADRLTARRALATQRRMTSAHARLASLYRHRMWSLVTLGGVVIAGMLWSGTNVQHNIAPGGLADPLYWFSYLVELMISACLVVIMVGTNKVSEYGITDDRRMVAAAELALLGLTIALNTYPYWHRGFTMAGAGVHAVPPVMIGVALMIHHAASVRYGVAIGKQAAELPDDALAPAAAPTTQDAYGQHTDPAPRLFGGHDADLTPNAHQPRRPDASVLADLLGSARTRRTVAGHVPKPIRPRPRAARVLYAPPRLRVTSPEVRRAATGRQDASAHIRSTRTQTPDASTPESERRGRAGTAHSATGAGNGRQKVDREQILRIAADHPSWSNKQIADAYGCSHSAVDKIFRAIPRPGVQPRPGIPNAQ
jgi:hypothetical protein